MVYLLPNVDQANLYNQLGVGNFSLTYSLQDVTKLRLMTQPYKGFRCTSDTGPQINTVQMLSNEDDITVGLVANGRPETQDAHRATGLFLNTVPLRKPVRSSSWQQSVLDVFAEEKKLLAFRHYPLAKLQELVGDHKIFDLVFNFTHFHVFQDALGIDGCELVDWQTYEETNFNMLANFGLHPVSGRLFVKIDYNTQKLHPEQIQLFIDYGLRILQQMVEHADACIDYQQLQPAAALPTIAPSQEANLLTKLEQQVREKPEHIAIRHDNQQWNYQTLFDDCQQLSHHLVQQGIRANSRIAILTERGYPQIIALLATLNTGSAYVPLDNSYPVSRLTMVLEDARPDLIIVDQSNLPLLQQLTSSAPVMVLEEHQSQITQQPITPLPQAINAETTAYILFTSGSTGRPKGVAMPHGALANLIDWQEQESANLLQPSPQQGAATLQFSPIGFDVSFQEIFSTLTTGGELVLVDQHTRLDPAQLLDTLITYRVQRLFLPYVALLHLAETALHKQHYPEALRQVITAGEQLKVTTEIRTFFAKLPQCRLDNQYGPTESHVVTAFSLQGDAWQWPALPPIGTAINNAQALLLNKTLQPVAEGITGDIYLAGACLADGYFQRDTLTESRFIQHPVTQQRLYKTGDMGVRLPDGNLIYLGREDAQVKIRGYRVELGEIEVQLQNYHPDELETSQSPSLIDSVAVTTRQRPNGEPFIAAFIQPHPGVTIEAKPVRQFLQNRLPEYMVPSHIQCIDALPVTPSGKVDQLALSQLPLQQETETARISPRDSIERDLVGIWKQELHLDSLCITDNFFEVGGNSLIAVRIVALIETHLQVQLPLASFISSPTIEQLAVQLRDGHQRNDQPLVCFNQQPEKTPLYFVHPIGGNVLCYTQMADYLANDYQFYALQAPITEDDQAPYDSIEALAAIYIDAMQENDLQEPVVLGGWSFGGFVAYEMARQLRSRGIRVASVLVLDSIAISQQPDTEVPESQLLSWFVWELLAGDWRDGHAVESLELTLDDEAETFATIKAMAVAQHVVPKEISLDRLRQMYAVFKANWHALLQYSLPVSDIPVTLFRARDALPNVLLDPHNLLASQHEDATNGWSRITQQLNVIDVPGDHLAMMAEPNIAQLANDIHTMIERDLT